MSTITLPEPSVGVPPGPSIPLAPPLAPVPPTGARAAASAAPPRSWLRGLVRGREADPAWVRPGILGLLAATALLYLWGLGASGWANSFYSAAVQAGSQSWKAFFFGSSDAANFITVDKPPVSLWLMALSVRVFGLSSWSILVPEALAGVASVGVLYAAVRRWFSPGAGLLAGAVLALTPAAALMFRFNNPDALLVLLLTIGAYGMVRAVESGSTRWLALASAMVGFGFLTKMLQALLVVPAFGLVYLVAGPPKLGRRLWQLVLSAGVLLVSAGWWVAIVELLPASMRPYIGGSQNNSVLNLIFGYNGLGRLTGNETGSVGGGGQAGSMWGPTGWLRLFNSEFGGQASWLLPAALIFLASGLLLTLRANRTDRTRASLILWGGWLVVTGATFSLGQGIIHPYYTVALAPAIGALVGIGAWLGWTRRSHLTGRAMLAAAIAATAWWSYELLDRTPTWLPWLRGAVLWFGLVAAVAMLFVHRARALVAAGVVTVALAAGLGGTAAYALATASQPHTGAIPSVGPSGVGGFGGGPGGGRFGGGQGGFPGGQNRAQAGTNGQGTFTGGGPGGNRAPGGGNGGGAGGLLNGSTPSAELVATLDANASKYTWVAATIGANQASGYQLSTGDPVMAIGGFNGTDPWPTLAQFQQYVAEGRIHYFIAGGGFGGGQGGSGTSSQISSWVSQHFTATTVGGVTLYDLTSSSSS